MCAEDAENLDVQAKLVLLLGHGNRSRRDREEDQGEKTKNSGQVANRKTNTVIGGFLNLGMDGTE